MKPRITWSKGWIDYDHLPITLSIVPTKEETLKDAPKELIIAALAADNRQTTASKLAEQFQTNKPTTLPEEYQKHAQVFSEEKAQRFPEPRIWDHAIELKKDTPATLPGKMPSPKKRGKRYESSLKNTSERDTSYHQRVHMLPSSSSLKRKMAN